MPLSARVIPVSQVTRTQREAMFALMARHYDNLHREVFESDLDEKDWVILLEQPGDNCLSGFSTQVLLEAQVPGRQVHLLFSGDTIVDREHWGTTALAIAWGKLVFDLLEQFSQGALYWYLASKGFRTYRFLPVYFREFYPRYDVPTPAELQDVMDAIGRQRYPQRYEHATGIIRAAATSDCLRGTFAELTEERQHDPHIDFFLTRNPGHQRGDELRCLARLSRDNFTPVARRLIDSERFARQVVSSCSPDC